MVGIGSVTQHALFGAGEFLFRHGTTLMEFVQFGQFIAQRHGVLPVKVLAPIVTAVQRIGRFLAAV